MDERYGLAIAGRLVVAFWAVVSVAVYFLVQFIY
jgi:hypothetical protein